MPKARVPTKAIGTAAADAPALRRRRAWVMRRAAATFGDLEKASAWMRRANRALGGQSPEAVLAKKGGAMLVLDALGRIEQGGLY